jgi:hypothetical protein
LISKRGMLCCGNPFDNEGGCMAYLPSVAMSGDAGVIVFSIVLTSTGGAEDWADN